MPREPLKWKPLKKGKSDIILGILGFGLPTTVFLMPLLFSSKLYLSFTLPQTVFFRAATVIFTALFFFYLAKRKIFPAAKNIGKSSALILLCLFFFASLLSLVFGVSPVISFFGSYFRQQGFLTELHYLLFFALIICAHGLLGLRHNGSGAKAQMRFFNIFFLAFSCSGSLIALYGILQKIGFDPLFENFFSAFLYGRIFSTLGQPDFLATYLLIPAAMSLALTFKEEKLLRRIGFAGLFLQVIAITLTLSRGGLLGLFVFLILFAFLLLRLEKRKKLSIILAAFFCAAVIGGIGLQLAKSTPLGAKLNTQPFISRFIFQGESLRSIESRLMIWQGALGTFFDSPFLGNGQETLSFTFPKYSDAKLLDLEPYQSLVDRAHNFLLDKLTNIGLFGTLPYLFFIAAVIVKVKRKGLEAPENIALVSGAAGFLASDLWLFELPTHSVAFFALLALMVLKTPNSRVYFEKLKSFSLKPLMITLLGLLLLPTIYFWNIKPILADAVFQKNLSSGGLSSDDLKAAKQSFETSPKAPLYGLYAAKISIASDKREDWETGVKILSDVFKISPFEIEAYPLLGALYGKLGLMQSSDEVFIEGVRLAPKSAVTILPFGNSLFSQKRYDEARRVYEYLLSISPAYWQWPAESLFYRSFYERERYRIFFKDNPEFIEVLRNMSVIYKTLGDSGKADFYAAAVAEIEKGF